MVFLESVRKGKEYKVLKSLRPFASNEMCVIIELAME